MESRAIELVFSVTLLIIGVIILIQSQTIEGINQKKCINNTNLSMLNKSLWTIGIILVVFTLTNILMILNTPSEERRINFGVKIYVGAIGIVSLTCLVLSILIFNNEDCSEELKSPASTTLYISIVLFILSLSYFGYKLFKYYRSRNSGYNIAKIEELAAKLQKSSLESEKYKKQLAPQLALYENILQKKPKSAIYENLLQQKPKSAIYENIPSRKVTLEL
jgi:hypothetical protein